MSFRPEDIAVKQFLVRARGYDREEVAAFLRAVAADYRQALAALESATAPVAAAAAAEAIAVDASANGSIGERWTAAVTERRAADLLAAASRRLEEVSARERRVAAAEQRVARQLQVVRDALRDAQLHVRGAIPDTASDAVPV